MPHYFVEFHPSQWQRWGQCARKAEWRAVNQEMRDDHAMHVGTYVGNLVHFKVTGHQFEKPDRIQFDRHTKTIKEAELQASRMAEVAEKEVERLHHQRNGHDVLYEIPVESQFTYRIDDAQATVTLKGTIDMVIDTLIVDLKTGINEPVGALMQTAFYAMARRSTAGPSQPDSNLGTIWVNRSHEPEVITEVASDTQRGLYNTDAKAFIRYLAFCTMEGAPPSPSARECTKCPVVECQFNKGEPLSNT